MSKIYGLNETEGLTDMIHFYYIIIVTIMAIIIITIILLRIPNFLKTFVPL